MRESDSQENMGDVDTIQGAEDGADAQDDYGDLTEDEVMARDMIAYIAGHLVDDQESVEVGTEWDGDRLKVMLRVADVDKGKVIGRNGRVVRAMQSLLRVSAVKSNIRASLDVV